MIFGHIVSLTTLLIFVSCGKELTEVNSAPATQDQAGIIAACATGEQAREYASTNNARFRILNSKRKLIEFYDTDVETLKKSIPNVKGKTRHAANEFHGSGGRGDAAKRPKKSLLIGIPPVFIFEAHKFENRLD